MKTTPSDKDKVGSRSADDSDVRLKKNGRLGQIRIFHHGDER